MMRKKSEKKWSEKKEIVNKVEGEEDDYLLSIAEEREDKIEYVLYVLNIESEREESSEPTGMNLKSNI